MTALIVLFATIAVASGLMARLVVPGGRRQPVAQSLLVGAGVTAVAGFVCWFVLTPVDGVLREPIALMLPVVLGLAAVAGWRTQHPAR